MTVSAGISTYSWIFTFSQENKSRACLGNNGVGGVVRMLFSLKRSEIFLGAFISPSCYFFKDQAWICPS